MRSFIRGKVASLHDIKKILKNCMMIYPFGIIGCIHNLYIYLKSSIFGGTFVNSNEDSHEVWE